MNMEYWWMSNETRLDYIVYTLYMIWCSYKQIFEQIFEQFKFYQLLICNFGKLIKSRITYKFRL